MKILTLTLLLTSLLSSCTYNYQLGVPNDASPNEYAIIKFHNTYRVSEIDGKIFSRKLSVWNEGSHSLKMQPGVHTFTLTYSNSAGSLAGSVHEYTSENSKVTVNMEAGKVYEIVSDIGLRQDKKINFSAVEVF